MAEKRMFAKSIVLSDAFLDMPLSTRCLYFTLGMLADDDGFVGSPKAIMRQCGASQDDLSILLSKRFVLAFDSGVIVIKHWRINNYLRQDRYIETTYLEEKQTLTLDSKGAYTEAAGIPVGIPPGIPVVDPDKNRLGKDSVEKNSLDKSAEEDNSKKELKGSKTHKGGVLGVFQKFAADDPELLSALKDFDSMRKAKDKPMTDRAKKIFLTKLKTFPRDQWIPILEQSIFHSWDSVYPLDESQSGKQNTDTSNPFVQMLRDME